MHNAIPQEAILFKEENGVQWYVHQVDKHNAVHYLAFDGQVISGSWVGPHIMFRGLANTTSEERMVAWNVCHSYEAFLAFIRERIREEN